MSDLRPLLDEGDDLVRDLLESAKDDVPDAAARAKTLGLLAGGATGATASAVTAAKPAGWLGLAPWKWLAMLALGAIAAGVLLSSKDAPPKAPSPPSPPPAPTLAEARPAEPAPASPATEAKTAPSVEVAAPSLPSVAPSAKKPAVPAAPSASAPAPRVGLAEETAMLDEARRALAGGDAKGALVVLDRYDREAKQRILGPEATMVRIEALHTRGDDASARTLAKKLLSGNPGSAYEDRVRTMLGDLGTP